MLITAAILLEVSLNTLCNRCVWFSEQAIEACEAAKLNLKSTQGKMKQGYDKNTKEVFNLKIFVIFW